MPWPCVPPVCSWVQSTGLVVEHIERWDVEPGRVLRQLLRPAAPVPTSQWEVVMSSVHSGDAAGVWLALRWVPCHSACSSVHACRALLPLLPVHAYRWLAQIARQTCTMAACVAHSVIYL